MTLLQVRTPEENTSLVIELLEKLGCEVEQKKSEKAKTKDKTIIEKKVSPTYLFGKWADLDIDPKTFRKKAWSRKK